jgi:osmotically-inducible protein OsmY
MSPNQILQRTFGIARDTSRQAERLGRRVAGDAYGVVQRARHLRSTPKPGMDDATLARKVETEIFRAADSPKATVNVNVVDGVVWLRGQVKRPEQIKRLERQVASIPEVTGVENLLHLPMTPAPTRADTPRTQQRTRSSTRRPSPRPQERVTDDHSSDLAQDAEPPPREVAEEGRGRSTAPLGAQRDEEQG